MIQKTQHGASPSELCIDPVALSHRYWSAEVLNWWGWEVLSNIIFLNSTLQHFSTSEMMQRVNAEFRGTNTVLCSQYHQHWTHKTRLNNTWSRPGGSVRRRERALVAAPSGKYGTINTSGASGDNFWLATYCTHAKFRMIIMHAYDDRCFCIKCTKINFDLQLWWAW
jgi:hypothetical protein